MEQVFTYYIPALIASLIGAIFVVCGIGIPVNDPDLTDKEKKHAVICNRVIYILAVFAILGFLCFDKDGQFMMRLILEK